MRGVALAGSGRQLLRASPGQAWAALLDADVLQATIPGAARVERLGAERFRATILFGVGWVAGRYTAELGLHDVREPQGMRLAGSSAGWFGRGDAIAAVDLVERPEGWTEVRWSYEGSVSGPVALVGRRLIQAGSDLFIRRFFVSLARRL